MSDGYSTYLESYVPVLAILVLGIGLTVAETGVFICIVAVSLAHAWRKGVLAWT